MFKKTSNLNLHRLEVNEDGMPVMPEQEDERAPSRRVGEWNVSRLELRKYIERVLR